MFDFLNICLWNQTCIIIFLSIFFHTFWVSNGTFKYAPLYLGSYLQLNPHYQILQIWDKVRPADVILLHPIQIVGLFPRTDWKDWGKGTSDHLDAKFIMKPTLHCFRFIPCLHLLFEWWYLRIYHTTKHSPCILCIHFSRSLRVSNYDTNMCFCICTEARDGEERRRGSSCSERQAANLAVPIHAQYPGQESLRQ